MHENVNWPRQMEKTASQRDSTKYYEFHNDHGHYTEECFFLKREVSRLHGLGLLKSLTGNKGVHSVDTDDDSSPEYPTFDNIINFLSGGYEVYGLTYSTAKRRSKASTDVIFDDGTNKANIVHLPSVSFGEEDAMDVRDPHHDGQVVTCM